MFSKARGPDSAGELRSRWSMDSLVRYGERLECLSEQYGKFEVGELNRRVSMCFGLLAYVEVNVSSPPIPNVF